MKAVLIKNDLIKSVVEKITTYDDFNIVGTFGGVYGLNPEIKVILLDDSIAINFKKIAKGYNVFKTKVEDILPFDIKADEDYKKQLANLRAERNQLLSETDFLIMPDYPISEGKKDEIKTYRQILRDFPATITKKNIDKVKFPEKPEV